MSKVSKVVCIGESLADFLPTDDKFSFKAMAGGAPANVCGGVAKLGGDAYYLGKLSTDFFGEFLLEKMKICNIKLDYLKRTSAHKTGLAFVILSDDGDRKFSIYHDNTADMMLDPNEIENVFNRGDILHFCSVGLIESPTKYAHHKAIDFARTVGALVSFDINVRLSLWKDENLCKSAIIEFLPLADIIKISEDELEFLYDGTEVDAVAKLLECATNAKLVFLTKGKLGVSVYDSQLNNFSLPAVDVKVVDTTGAGDCFSSGIIYEILTNKVELDLKSIKDATIFASYCSGVIISRKGAMESMPTLDEVKKLMSEVSL